MRRDWTRKEEDFLLKNYAFFTFAEIARRLNRTRAAVAIHYYKIAPRQQRQLAPPLPPEAVPLRLHNRLLQLHAEGCSDRTTARRLNNQLTLGQVRRWREYHGLPGTCLGTEAYAEACREAYYKREHRYGSLHDRRRAKRRVDNMLKHGMNTGYDNAETAILVCLRDHGPLTSYEIAEKLGLYASRVRGYYTRRVVTKLLKLEAIYRAGQKRFGPHRNHRGPTYAVAPGVFLGDGSRRPNCTTQWSKTSDETLTRYVESTSGFVTD